MPQIDYEYWKLNLSIAWVKKHGPLYEEVPCDACMHGSRFCQIEDEICPKCRDTGYMKKELPYPKAPPVPEDLVVMLENTYQEYLKK